MKNYFTKKKCLCALWLMLFLPSCDKGKISVKTGDNTCVKDSDGDGICDKEDPHPHLNPNDKIERGATGKKGFTLPDQIDL